jgi:hypothetical protein
MLFMEAVARTLVGKQACVQRLGNSSQVSLGSVKASASSGHNSFLLDLEAIFPESRQTLRCEFDCKIKF